MILTISGRSGSGKSTLLGGIMHTRQGVAPLESITTRKSRPTDVAGEYVYVSHKEFDALKAERALLWHVKVHDYRFGTRKDVIEEAFTKGFFVALLAIEAAEKLHQYAKEKNLEHHLRSVYLDIDNEDELRRRLIQRGDTADLEKRILDCRNWGRQAQVSSARFKLINASATAQVVLLNTLNLCKI